MKCTQMRARVEKRSVLGWNKSYSNTKWYPKKYPNHNPDRWLFYFKVEVLYILEYDTVYIIIVLERNFYLPYYSIPSSTVSLYSNSHFQIFVLYYSPPNFTKINTRIRCSNLTYLISNTLLQCRIFVLLSSQRT